jgi:predicted RNA-binding Zn-ribbon protein involved in translation (DUF1610 family)
MLEIRGQATSNYINLHCTKCGTGAKRSFMVGGYTSVEYIGWDDHGIPRFKVTCKQCGETAIWRVNMWPGLPPEPYKGE